MRFEADQPAVEFQTGHALWALAAAGIPSDHPQVARAIRFLLARQQPFGGWMDPLQSYENFRTPFRETQFAVVALSTYFPSNRSRRKGWNARVDRLSEDPVELLGQIDRLWDPPPAAVLEKLEQAAASNDALIRQQAVEALGRLGGAETLGAAIELLGDPSKLVQRTAARAVRQIYSRHENAPAEALLAALDSRDGRARWGATRVFATHFAALARSPKFAGALARRVADPIATIRMQALKGLWQFWFWTPDEGARDRIEDTFLSAMARPQHPWVERNLREGIYNLADENIRYFYNNWVPLLARAEDRERAIHGRLVLESRLARKFAETLERGSERQKRTLLAGLAELQLRRADVYDLAADQSRPAPAIYNRIGNDIEQSVFFGASADRFARALLPLLDSPDAETRRLASMAALLTRDITFPGVIQAAGRPGKDRDALLQVLAGRESEYPEVVKAMRPPAARSAARAATGPAAHRSRSAATRPDATFFRGYVQPILEKRGKDGYACVHCHSSHTLFNGSYATALNVVDVDHPENSLILRKPTSSAESEGTLGAKTLSHGGGVRWEKDSPEYQTILKWIRGAGQ
jgi:hypothetical protein